MGNSNSNTTTKKNIPQKPYVLGPVNGYNYYNQAAYMPQPYAYPMFVPTDYPADYPVVSDQNALSSQYASKKSKSKNKSSKTEISPVYDYEHNHHQSGHNHHQSGHDHHNHHHHHHHRHEPSPMRDHGTSPPPLTMFEEKKNTVPPVAIKRIITPTVSVPLTQQYTAIPPPQQQQQYYQQQPPPPPPPLLATSVQRSPTMHVQASPIPLSQEPSFSSPRQPPIVIKSDIFERAPFLETNRVAKSPDRNAIYNYGPGPISIVKHSALRQGTAGNRWYDHDYDKRVKSIIVNDT